MLTADQWTVEHGYIVAKEFDYDISFNRLDDPDLLPHMAQKTWVDMDKLKAAIELAKSVSSFNAADDDSYPMGED